jgi:hypothetical protein
MRPFRPIPPDAAVLEYGSDAGEALSATNPPPLAKFCSVVFEFLPDYLMALGSRDHETRSNTPED